MSNKAQYCSHPPPPPPPPPVQQIYVDGSTALIAAIEQVREFAGKFRAQPVRWRRWFYVTRYSKVTELIMLIKNRLRSASGRMRGKERRSLSRPVSPFRKLSLAVKAGLAWPERHSRTPFPRAVAAGNRPARISWLSAKQLAAAYRRLAGPPVPAGLYLGPIYRSGCLLVHQ